MAIMCFVLRIHMKENNSLFIYIILDIALNDNSHNIEKNIENIVNKIILDPVSAYCDEKLCRLLVNFLAFQTF